MTTNPTANDKNEKPRQVPAPHHKPDGMKRPLEVADLALQVLALLLILARLCGVDVPPLTVELPVGVVALVVKLVVIAADREH